MAVWFCFYDSEVFSGLFPVHFFFSVFGRPVSLVGFGSWTR
jgi:hypothetical protein